MVGLFASDGCLSPDGRHLIMTSKDPDIIAAVSDITKTNAKFRLKRGSYAQTLSMELQLGDVALYDFFLEAGLTPAKSKTLKVKNIPDEYFGDYLRGLFDGDGTIFGFRDKRWRSSYMFYTTFYSANKDFLIKLQADIARLYGTGKGTLCAGARVFKLSYAKADSSKIFAAMYAAPESPRLTRKYDRFLALLQQNPYAYNR